MIAVKIDTQNFASPDKLSRFISADGQADFLRAVCLSMLPVVHDRIHVNGKAADGSPIGIYSDLYLKYTRPKNNRGTDPKVILSLTRQMENDFSVVADGSRYGLGFKNEVNAQKSEWAEQTYKKKIYSLTNEEKEQAVNAANEYVNGVL